MCASLLVQLRIRSGVVFGCKLEDGRYGGRRSGSWLRHRFTAVAQVRAWRAGVLRRRRRKAAGPELLVVRQLTTGRVGGGNTDGVVGRDRESGARDELSPDGAGWGCLQATEERQRSADHSW